jgi:hypothetical protein
VQPHALAWPYPGTSGAGDDGGGAEAEGTGRRVGNAGGAAAVVGVAGGSVVVVVVVVALTDDDVGAVAGALGGGVSRETRAEAIGAHGLACGEVATGRFVIWASATTAAMRT